VKRVEFALQLKIAHSLDVCHTFVPKIVKTIPNNFTDCKPFGLQIVEFLLYKKRLLCVTFSRDLLGQMCFTIATKEDFVMTVSVYEARTKFSALLDRLEKEKDTVTITRRNRAVAQLVPITHGKRSTVHKELCPIIPKGIDWTEPTQEEWEDA